MPTQSCISFIRYTLVIGISAIFVGLELPCSPPW